MQERDPSSEGSHQDPQPGGTGKAPTPPWHPNSQEQRTRTWNLVTVELLPLGASSLHMEGPKEGLAASADRAKGQKQAPSCPCLVPCPSCPGVLEKETQFLSLPMNKPSRADPAEGVLQTLPPASHGATQDPTGFPFFLPRKATSQTSLFEHKASLPGQTFPVWVLQDTGAGIVSLRNRQCCTISAKLVPLVWPEQLLRVPAGTWGI